MVSSQNNSYSTFWVYVSLLCTFLPNKLLFSFLKHTSLRTSKILGSSWPCQFRARRIYAPAFFRQWLALNFFILSIWITFRSTHHWSLRTDLLGLTIRGFYSYKRKNQWAVIKRVCLRRDLISEAITNRDRSSWQLHGICVTNKSKST